jgi:hypothetical protein
MVLKTDDVLIFYADMFVIGDLACLLKLHKGYASFIYKCFEALQTPQKAVQYQSKVKLTRSNVIMKGNI